MPTMVVRADFPLGTFLGHRDVGLVADFPDTARLHAALLHAAGKGSGAVEQNGQLRPAPASVEALEWLEQHPPFGVRHPDIRRVSVRPAQAWRPTGTFNAAKQFVAPRRELKSQSDAVAVAGPFEWGWRDAPSRVLDMLAGLCADVACLGESDSPVQLSLASSEQWVPALLLDPQQSGFPAPGGLAVRTPAAGRVAELERDYEASNPPQPPTMVADKYRAGQGSLCPRPSAGSVRQLVYRSSVSEPTVPWPQVLLVEVDAELDTLLSVAWSVAFHRALVARVPEPAPSLITGRYPSPAVAPANRLALHVLPACPAISPWLTRTVFAVMIPAGATSADLDALEVALRGLSRVYGRQGQVRLVGVPRLVGAAQFWSPPVLGSVRFWRPLPALIPEVRRQRDRDHRQWTLADAAALSAAYVFRDRLALEHSGPDRHAGAVRAATAAGFAIHEVHAIRDSRLDRYAHKTPAGVTVQPYTGLVELGTLAPAGALLALGQSRHLGGGLLFPEDLPLPVARARGLTA